MLLPCAQRSRKSKANLGAIIHWLLAANALKRAAHLKASIRQIGRRSWDAFIKPRKTSRIAPLKLLTKLFSRGVMFLRQNERNYCFVLRHSCENVNMNCQ